MKIALKDNYRLRHRFRTQDRLVGLCLSIVISDINLRLCRSRVRLTRVTGLAGCASTVWGASDCRRWPPDVIYQFPASRAPSLNAEPCRHWRSPPPWPAFQCPSGSTCRNLCGRTPRSFSLIRPSIARSSSWPSTLPESKYSSAMSRAALACRAYSLCTSRIA